MKSEHMQNQHLTGFQLSPQQKRLWLLGNGNPPFLSHIAVLITGKIRVDALYHAMDMVVRRHEILRTTFCKSPGMPFPFQVVHETLAPSWRIRNLSESDSEELGSVIKSFLEEEHRRPINWSHGPLLWLQVLKVAENRQVLLITAPSLCLDTSSLFRIIQEVVLICAGQELSSDVLQYADYAEWINELIEPEDDEKEEPGKSFWREHEIWDVSSVDLPIGGREKHDSFQPDLVSFTLKSSILAELETVARKYQSSTSDVLLACWLSLLWRLTGQPTMVLGFECSGRTQEELNASVGLFSKWLPVTCHFDSGVSFSEVLQASRESSQGAQEWQDYFRWDQAGLKDPGSNNEALPFSAGFEFEHIPEAFSVSDVTYAVECVMNSHEPFKVKLSCLQHADSLKIQFYVNRQMLSVKEARRLGDQFQMLLMSMLKDPDVLVSQLDILSDDERSQVLDEFNLTSKEIPGHLCIHQIFQQQTTQTPDYLAVVYEEHCLTYAELNARSNQVAHYLRQHGVEPDVVVGLCLERSVEMLIGLLGILKAGGAYLPLDPSLPQERLNYMIQEAGVAVLVTQEKLHEQLLPFQVSMLCLDVDSPVISHGNQVNLDTRVCPSNLAYVLFTSGSTGRPKGVQVEHRQLVNYVYGILDRLDLPAGSSFATVSPLATDLGNTMLYPSLCTGGTLHVLSEERASDPDALGVDFQHHRPDCLKIVPSHLEALLTGSTPEWVLPRKRLVVGGEACRWSLIEKVHALMPECVVINHYGPTETTVGVTTSYVENTAPQERKTTCPPIGRPLPNTQVYVLDERYQPVPLGVSGELYVGGAGLARGYAHRSDFTAERFIPHPFTNIPGARLYKTGDRARYQSDGTLEFLGRMDRQVKLRGFRIELGEIEAVLELHPSVQEGLVVAREDEPGVKRLVAYMVATKVSLSSSDLRRHVRQILPEYMVPSVFVVLDVFPHTPNGKVDLRALPEPTRIDTGHDRAFAAPRGPLEEALVEIWQEVFGIDQVGIHDNFFELGGHSLMASQLMVRIQKTFQQDIPLRLLFDAPTIAELADHLVTPEQISLPRDHIHLGPVPRDEALPLSFAQQRLWFLDQFEPDGTAYLSTRALRLTGPLNHAALEQSLNALVVRHESLRTTFATRDGTPVQVIAPSLTLPLPIVDLQALSADAQVTAIRQRVQEEVATPFDLSVGPLIRVTLLQVGPEEHVFLLTLHHIITDGWSKGIFFDELSALYDTLSMGKVPALPTLQIQYADFAAWQRKHLAGKRLEQHLSYWKRQLAHLPVLDLPTDRPRPPIQTHRGAKQSFSLSQSLSEAVKALTQQEGATPFITLLAAFMVLLHRYTKQVDIVVGSPIANRTRMEIEGLIGYFMNILILRADLSGNPSFRELLGRIRKLAYRSL